MQCMYELRKVQDVSTHSVSFVLPARFVSELGILKGLKVSKYDNKLVIEKLK
jgi:hypothetical protein